ncbi:MAG TPA: DM13 domain-containing protein [Nitrososphaeraceae archaeon]|nr:DM13 domain-containing protein [Nitrososphaeraceae archaeon]
MNKKKAIIVVIIIAAIAIPVGIYTVSPLFINTTVNEPLPTSSSVTDLQKFQEFMSMNSEEERVEEGQQMATEEKNAILRGAAQTNGNTVNENMTEAAATTLGQTSLFLGEFVGVNDGIHNAEGMAKVIQLDDASMILRLENFKATNGPDLYVYLATDNSASDFVNLGKLKGNIGNQNYDIPEGTDFSKYHAVLIWCQAFSVLFGSAELEPQR